MIFSRLVSGHFICFFASELGNIILKIIPKHL